VCLEKVVHFVFEHNFTTTSAIFLQFSMIVMSRLTSPIACHNVKITTGLKEILFAIKTCVLYAISICNIYRIYELLL